MQSSSSVPWHNLRVFAHNSNILHIISCTIRLSSSGSPSPPITRMIGSDYTSSHIFLFSLLHTTRPSQPACYIYYLMSPWLLFFIFSRDLFLWVCKLICASLFPPLLLSYFAGWSLGGFPLQIAWPDVLRSCESFLRHTAVFFLSHNTPDIFLISVIFFRVHSSADFHIYSSVIWYHCPKTLKLLKFWGLSPEHLHPALRCFIQAHLLSLNLDIFIPLFQCLPLHV